MKRFIIISIMTLLGIALLSSMSFAAGKPLKAYISGAKICIVEGRPDEALILLDSALNLYGPVPEAYQWAFRVYADKMEAAAGLDGKRPPLTRMLAYIDSLHLSCEETITVQDKKYLKDCKKFIQLADSTKVKYFRIFYNQGHEQIKTLSRLADDLQNESDSSRQAYIKGEINENIDSVIANMSMVIMIDSSEFSPYVAIGDAYNRAGDPVKAGEWMMKGYILADSSLILAKQLAFLHIEQEDYCAAVPYLNRYVSGYPDSTNMLNYLAVCYNNCSLEPGHESYLDSSMAINRMLLSKTPQDAGLLGTFGRYFLVQAQRLSDKASDSRKAGNEAQAKEFDVQRKVMFDSSYTYFKQAWEAAPDNTQLAEQFGFTALLREDCVSAVQAFEVVAKARPDDFENWLSLGDCYLRMGDFPNATRSYEKVSELKPDKTQVWENLSALYKQAGQNEKAAEAAKKVQQLTSGQG